MLLLSIPPHTLLCLSLIPLTVSSSKHPISPIPFVSYPHTKPGIMKTFPLIFSNQLQWCTNLLHPLHKASDVMNVTNYHTLMIGHTMAQVYGSVLQRIISKYAEDHRLYARGHPGFRSDYSTVDHIHMLRCIIEEAKHSHRKVYCYSMDFRKSFDIVPRHLLTTVVVLYERVLARFRDGSNFSPSY